MKPYARFIIGESFADIIFFGFAFRIISAMSVFWERSFVISLLNV